MWTVVIRIFRVNKYLIVIVYRKLIREIGLEPTHLSIHAPKARLATNYSIHVIKSSIHY